MQRLEQYDVFPIPVGRIYYDSLRNCRGEFTLQSVADLAESITQTGRLLEPVWVQPACDVPGLEGFDFRLIAGHRRFKAVTTYLGWTEIPATVYAGLSDRQARVLNFTENLERKDLNPLEEALAMRALYPNVVIEGDTAHNRSRNPERTTVQQIAGELKRDSKWVNYRIRLLLVPEEVQHLVAARRVSLLDLEIVCRKETPEAQIKAAQALAASKRGKGRKAVFVDEKLTRSFKRRRNKSEINAKVAMILNLPTTPERALLARGLVWSAGLISDQELDAEILAEPKTKPDTTLY